MKAEILEALDDLVRERGITREVLIEAIEAALISAYRRNFGSAQNVRVLFDPKTGDYRVYAQKEIVEQVEDSRLQVSLEEARAKNPGLALGDIFEVEVTPRDFGRIAAQTAKQVVVQRIREAERGIVFEEYSSREGDIVTGLVLRQDPKTRAVYVELSKGVEAILTGNEQIPGERFTEGRHIKAYVIEVKRTTKGPAISISRTHPGLLKRLFELEVPEIHDGVVEVKGISREAGSRSKIAVYSRDEDVDALGACVGMKGQRVQNIVTELQGEKIDVVEWSQDPTVFVQKALSPAKVISVDCEEVGHVARVVVPDYQLSLAIGKEGQNARLAAKLTGWKIDIKSETQAKAGAWEETESEEESEEE
ncbi:MAG: transcription termination factor NusA [Mycobacterium leprae]